jgi:hypothetical protein
MRRPPSMLLLVAIAGCASDGVARPDPGAPADFHGPKCTVEIAGVPLPQCLSAPIEPRGEATTLLFFNFCIANDEDRCRQRNMPSPLYVSLLLPTSRWTEGHYPDAVAGRVELALPDGRRWRLDSGRGDPLPIDLSVRGQPNGAGTSFYGELLISLPRVDAPGAAVTLRARAN